MDVDGSHRLHRAEVARRRGRPTADLVPRRLRDRRTSGAPADGHGALSVTRKMGLETDPACLPDDADVALGPVTANLLPHACRRPSHAPDARPGPAFEAASTDVDGGWWIGTGRQADSRTYSGRQMAPLPPITPSRLYAPGGPWTTPIAMVGGTGSWTSTLCGRTEASFAESGMRETARSPWTGCPPCRWTAASRSVARLRPRCRRRSIPSVASTNSPSENSACIWRYLGASNRSGEGLGNTANIASAWMFEGEDDYAALLLQRSDDTAQAADRDFRVLFRRAALTPADPR